MAPEDPLDILHRHLRSDGLAAVGTPAVVEALAAGLVDTLFLAPRWNQPGSRCPTCGAVDARADVPACGVCGGSGLERVELREHLARLAASSGARLEFLPPRDALHQLGIASLLRMRRRSRCNPPLEERSLTMETVALSALLAELAHQEETSGRFLSCYLRVATARWQLRRRIESLMAGRSPAGRAEIVEAFRRAERRLADAPPWARSMVGFFRDGFERVAWVPGSVNERIAWSPLPLLAPLVELKRHYRRYVLVLTTRRRVRVVEVVLGPTTARLWSERPELRSRVGPEWSVQRYLRHRRKATGEHLVEKVRLLERLVDRGGDAVLVLAGDLERVEALRRALPERLRRRLLSEALELPELDAPDSENVIRQTLEDFLGRLEGDSRSVEDALRAEVETDGLASTGVRETLEALSAGVVDTLFLASDWVAYGSACPRCGAVDARTGLLSCPVCLSGLPHGVDLREALIRLAAQGDCRIEPLVRHPELGVGALLRMRPEDARLPARVPVTA